VTEAQPAARREAGMARSSGSHQGRAKGPCFAGRTTLARGPGARDAHRQEPRLAEITPQSSYAG
jgi:hypothetical protein